MFLWDLAGFEDCLLKGKPFFEAGLFAGLQLETDAVVALVRLPVVVPAEQYFVRYALRERLAADLAVLQVPAEVCTTARECQS